MLAKRLLTAALCFAGVIAGIICIDVRRLDRVMITNFTSVTICFPSYVAGTFVREGRPRDMYDIDAVHREEAKIVSSADLSLDHQGGPLAQPAVLRMAVCPLRRVLSPGVGAFPDDQSGAPPFMTCCSAQLPVQGWRNVLVPLSSAPRCRSAGVGHQQNTFISLFLLTLTMTLWQSGRLRRD